MALLTTKSVAAKTGLSADAIRWHERHGRLLSIKVERSPGIFMRLFLEEDVQRFMRQREAQEQAKQETEAKTKNPSARC